MSAPQTFGQAVRALRRAATPPATLRDLAARVEARMIGLDRRGFDLTYLSKIENDRLPPPSEAAIVALAAELGADADALLALAGRPPVGLAALLAASPGARAFWRAALLGESSPTEDQWRRLTDALPCRAGRG